MNYFALACGIASAALALVALSTILRVSVGKAHFRNTFAALAQSAYVAGFGTLAVWLFSIAFG